MARQHTACLRSVATCGAVTIAAATCATGAASQLSRPYEAIVLDDLVVCSNLEGITKSTLVDVYRDTTSTSIMSAFAAPKPTPPLLPGLRVFVATDGTLDTRLLNCLASHSTDQLDLVAMTRDVLSEPLPDDVFPDWMKLGPTIVSWATSCMGDDCIVTYVRWNYDPADAQAVLDDFLGLPD